MRQGSLPGILQKPYLETTVKQYSTSADIKGKSNLEYLIEQLCPDGVEYKTLGELGTFVRGNGLQKKDFVANGVGCIHYGQIYTYYDTVAYTTKSFVTPELANSLKKVKKCNLIIACTSENVEDVCKSVAWLGDEEIVIGGHSAIFSHSQNPKYIAYFFQCAYFFEQKRKIATGTKVIEVAPVKLKKIKIPVPPLPIQEEIVRILDTFSELIAELTAELNKRKQQYQYYRDELLKFGDDVEWYEFKKCIKENIGGGTPSKTNKYYWNGNIPWASVKDIVNCNLYLKKTKDFITNIGLDNSPSHIIRNGNIIVATRINCGKMVITNIDVAINQDLRGIILNNTVLNKYVVYYFQTLKIEGIGTTVKGISIQELENIKIPVPPISEQERIVSILDRFDALCNDLTSGLPAEINARKKQYEYYRDKLLTFKELKK